MGVKFLDVDRLAALIGGPVRTGFRLPHETSNGLPPADAVVVAPATFNTINKWALGITDTVAAGMLCELVGFGVPTLAVPQVKAELASHVAFEPNLTALRSMGVRVPFDPAAPPSARMPPWKDILTELHTILDG
jgi:phosphopantothenoylcysteine synthetase/decarboxylase